MSVGVQEDAAEVVENKEDAALQEVRAELAKKMATLDGTAMLYRATACYAVSGTAICCVVLRPATLRPVQRCRTVGTVSCYGLLCGVRY
eukprot:3876951-Rhodomonas_salina.1